MSNFYPRYLEYKPVSDLGLHCLHIISTDFQLKKVPLPYERFMNITYLVARKMFLFDILEAFFHTYDPVEVTTIS